MRDGSTEHLLHQLGTPMAGEAWAQFLRNHTPTIVSVARQYQRDKQHLHDCYLYVCEKLVDNEFRRLRAWERKKNVRFSSWLRAVVANLCVDWHRSEFGRRRPFRSIEELPELDRLAYTHRFEYGANFRECYEAVAIRHPQVTELELAAIIRRINRILTPQQQWAIATRRRVAMSFEDAEVRREASLAHSEGGTPEDHTVGDEEQARLRVAMQRLTTQQRLLLKLRYQQGMSLKQVARLSGFDDPFKARYQIEKALEQLRLLLVE